ncbi:MAG TPA: (Fe-S)-binding protein [Acidiferrobacterales bacterium]
MPAPRTIEPFPVALADRCVLCGLCLPHCPTYRLTGDENESPRGRIALMRALAGGELKASAKLAGHLELCLGCRACERVCPSQVPYGRLIDAGRALLAERRRPPRRQRWLRDALLTRPRRLRRLARWLRRYQRSGAQRLLRASHLLGLIGLAKAERLLPPLPALPAWQPHYPAIGTRRGAVDLFLGCVASAFDAATLEAAVRLLTRLGYDVHLPASQGCCGAQHRHAGDAARATGLVRANVAAFAGSDRPIVFLASGCGASLVDAGRELAGDAAAAAFAARAIDLQRFLVDIPWPGALELAPLPALIAVHEPCTLRNALGDAAASYRLLERIPQVRIVALPENALCCGGAGSYPLTQPAMAERLRDAKLAHVLQLAPDYLATANIGCALQLAAGARAAGLAVEVVHPVALIERALRPAPPAGLAAARTSGIVTA